MIALAPATPNAAASFSPALLRLLAPNGNGAALATSHSNPDCHIRRVASVTAFTNPSPTGDPRDPIVMFYQC